MEVTLKEKMSSTLHSLKVGDEFPNYLSLEDAIRRYEEATYTNLMKIASRTIDGARRKGLKRKIAPELEFVEITYGCIKHGKYKSQSRGIRPKQSTFKEDCPVLLKVGANKDGNKLVVMKFTAEHNHVQSKAIYDHLPRQRRLDPEAKVAAMKLIKMKVNRKLLQNELMRGQDKVITLKDIHNLSISKEASSASVLQIIAGRYREQRGTTFEMFSDEDGLLRGIFYQDPEMKRLFSLCPEIVFIDAIYKTIDSSMPLYVFLIENPNGENEIVGICLLTSENQATVSMMVKIFKKHNSKWDEIKTVMADKDSIERIAINVELPNAQILICFFHYLRSVSCEVTTEKMGITQEQCSMCLKILQDMVFAVNEYSYIALYKQLKNTKLDKVLQYFNNNWHPIKSEWVISLQSSFTTFTNRTNSNLESINQKITLMLSRFSIIDQVFEGLDNLLTSFRTELDHTAANVFSRSSLLLHNLTTTEQQFYQLLTPYAFEIVSSKLQLKEKVKITKLNKANGTAVVASLPGNVVVTSTKCGCRFATSMLLPCEHLFKLRELLALDMYSEDLHSTRWSRQYYRRVCRIFPNELQTKQVNLSEEHAIPVVCNMVDFSEKEMSTYEKFQCASKETTVLATLASEASGVVFRKRIALLKQLKSIWETNQDFSLVISENLIVND